MNNARSEALTHDGELIPAERQGWTPRQIRAALMLQGIQLNSLAETVGVSPSAVTQTINQYDNPYKNRFKGYRIREVIAETLGVEASEIWPDRN